MSAEATPINPELALQQRARDHAMELLTAAKGLAKVAIEPNVTYEAVLAQWRVLLEVIVRIETGLS